MAIKMYMICVDVKWLLSTKGPNFTNLSTIHVFIENLYNYHINFILICLNEINTEKKVLIAIFKCQQICETMNEILVLPIAGLS